MHRFMPCGTAVADMRPVRAHTAIIVETVDDGEGLDRSSTGGNRLGSDVETERFFPGAGDLEIKVRRQDEANAVLHVVGFAIDRNLTHAGGRQKALAFPGLDFSGCRLAGLQRGIADGRNVFENRAALGGMQVIRTLQPGEHVVEDQFAVHRAGLGVPPIVDEHVNIGVLGRVNRCRIECILPGFLRCGGAGRSLCVAGCGSQANREQ